MKMDEQETTIMEPNEKGVYVIKKEKNKSGLDKLTEKRFFEGLKAEIESTKKTYKNPFMGDSILYEKILGLTNTNKCDAMFYKK